MTDDVRRIEAVFKLVLPARSKRTHRILVVLGILDLTLTFGFPLRRLVPPRIKQVLNRQYLIRALLPKSLEEQIFDESGQWSLPPLLVMVREAPEFLGVQPQLPRHLDMSVRQVKQFSCVHPHLKLWR